MVFSLAPKYSLYNNLHLVQHLVINIIIFLAQKSIIVLLNLLLHCTTVLSDELHNYVYGEFASRVLTQ